MPRVHTKKAQTRRWTTRDKYLPSGVSVGDLKPNWTCGKCREEIKPGDTYKEWSFRYGGTQRRCAKTECAPRDSDLTQSKMAQVYSAREEAEDTLNAWGGADDGLDMLKDALSQFAQEVRDVASEYEEAAEHFGGQGENQERAEALESWADEIDSALDNVADEPEVDHQVWVVVNKEDKTRALEEDEYEESEQAFQAAIGLATQDGTGFVVLNQHDQSEVFEDREEPFPTYDAAQAALLALCEQTSDDPANFAIGFVAYDIEETDAEEPNDEEKEAWADEARSAFEEAIGNSPY